MSRFFYMPQGNEPPSKEKMETNREEQYASRPLSTVKQSPPEMKDGALLAGWIWLTGRLSSSTSPRA